MRNNIPSRLVDKRGAADILILLRSNCLTKAGRKVSIHAEPKQMIMKLVLYILARMRDSEHVHFFYQCTRSAAKGCISVEITTKKRRYSKTHSSHFFSIAEGWLGIQTYLNKYLMLLVNTFQIYLPLNVKSQCERLLAHSIEYWSRSNQSLDLYSKCASRRRFIWNKAICFWAS
jgi:hypothetical protein